MNLNKERKEIDSLIINIYNCKSVDLFYELASKLYFKINCIVFNFSNNLEMENKCNEEKSSN